MANRIWVCEDEDEDASVYEMIWFGVNANIGANRSNLHGWLRAEDSCDLWLDA